jgi:hypothetical protein
MLAPPTTKNYTQTLGRKRLRLNHRLVEDVAADNLNKLRLAGQRTGRIKPTLGNGLFADLPALCRPTTPARARSGSDSPERM